MFLKFKSDFEVFTVNFVQYLLDIWDVAPIFYGIH